MEILYFVALNVLGHVAFVGARMTTSLFALRLGAGPGTVGMVMALFAALPMLLSVTAGRLIDHAGPRRPLMAALIGLALGSALPFLVPRLETLFVSSTILGVSFMFVHIGMNTVIGAHGSVQDRPMNFAWLALAFSISGSLGPLIAGFAIEGLGHAAALLLLAVFPAIAAVMLGLRKRPLPRPERHPAAGGRLLDLFQVAGLRHAFLVSGVLATGWDLYAFLMPLYGAQIGLAPASIGLVMATFAVATFVVRLAMRVLIRRVQQWVIILASMAVAGASYALFPLASSAGPLVALSFLLGLGLGCAQPVIMSLLYETAPPGRQSEAVGVRTTLINASQTFIPLGSGALASAVGMGPVFGVLAAALLCGAWYVRKRGPGKAL
ncbi:MAG: MFS transporter [Betaproteobacteria bacterium]|nr:MFS transporter [Betaproteobacteria bacterium]